LRYRRRKSLGRVPQQVHASRLAEKATALLDGGAEMARQAGLLAGQDLFWVVMWVGLAGAVLLSMQRRFD